MVVHPRFYNRPTAAECAKKRLDMGLNPALFTVLILFGGSPPTDRVVRLVDLFMSRPASRAVNVITVCAKNNQLYDRLRRRRQKKPRELLYVTAYSSEIPLFMHISDLLIGKPGPGVVSEAYVTRLPFILITGRSEHHVMQQERDVLAWVRRNEIGQIVHTDREAAAITFDTITTMKEHIAAQRENRAVFEVRDLILKSLGFDPLPRHADDNPDMAGGVDMSEIAAYVPVISSMDLASADSSASSSTSSVEADKLGTRATRQRTGGDSGMSPTTITVAAPSSNPKRQDLLPSTRATFPVNTEQNRDIAAHKKTAA